MCRNPYFIHIVHIKHIKHLRGENIQLQGSWYLMAATRVVKVGTG